jgi:hypothetical protein
MVSSWPKYGPRPVFKFFTVGVPMVLKRKKCFSRGGLFKFYANARGKQPIQHPANKLLLMKNYIPLVVNKNDKKAANIIKSTQTGINRNI